MTNQDEKLMTSITNSLNELDEKLCKLDSLLKLKTKEISTRKEGNKMKFVYETKTIKDSKKSKLIKKAKEFFQENLPKEDETFIALRVTAGKYNTVDIYGAYFGEESSPVDIYAQSGSNRKKAFLAEALDEEGMTWFIENSGNESIYLFKVKYVNFKMQEITSFYGEKYQGVNLLVYDSHEDEREKGMILQQFGMDKVVFPLESINELD